MGGDYSRVTWKQQKNYSGVRLQQGRVQLDADWNEQVDIQAHRDQTTVRDVVGPSGAPYHRPDEFNHFKVRAVGKDIEIADGHIYVDGILCENNAFDENNAVAKGTNQPNLPAGTPIVRRPDGTPETQPPPTGQLATAGTYLAYLDVWQRDITALEDPSIREDALGGPDTAIRTKTVWQVLLLRVGDESAFDTANCLSSFPEWNSLVGGGTGQLRAQAQPAGETNDNPCLVPPGGGYRRQENQLYRVEVHEGGPHGTAPATFKWSRDNAMIVTEWLGQDGNELTVGSAGRDTLLGFAAGQWVELTDDTRELQGLPGVLVRLARVDGRVLTIDPETIDPGTTSIDWTDFPVNPKVRRWDLPETGILTVETPTTNSGYLPLEDGVEVRFEPGDYRSGDHWLIPARTLKADVEWPRKNGQPEAQAPHGIRHHFCRLALLRVDKDGNLTVSDCRQLFPPLTELTSFFYIGGGGQEALPTESGQPGVKLRQPLQVGVANGQWPVPGTRVRFAAVPDPAGTTPDLNGRLELADGSQAGQSLTVLTGPDGVAECFWRLGKLTEDRRNLSQRVTATLLDPAGQTRHLPIHFSASVSVASEVGYAPGGACTNLVGVKTVQEAIDELCKTGDNVQGIHIKDVRTIEPDTPLPNDTSVPAPLLVKGLRVVCDMLVDENAVSGKPTCFVTLDLPFPFNTADKELWGDKVIGHQPLILRGSVRVEDRGQGRPDPSITWIPADDAAQWLRDVLFDRMARQGRGNRVLAHLTLKGNFIWARGNAAFYLDGDSFGVPAQGGTTGLDLRHGSGDQRRGGDFEMWFWLEQEKPGLKSLTISQPAVVTGGGRLKGTVTLSGRASEVTRVKLDKNNAAVTVPEFVEVQAGELNKDFDIQTSPVSTPQDVILTARLQGSADQTATLTVQPPQLADLSLNVTNPTGQPTVGGTVTLNGRAPASGIDVALSSSNEQVAAVPSSRKVTVPAGQLSATFTVTTVGPGETNIIGTLGASDSAVLRVLPKIEALQLDANAVIRGRTVGGTITLTSAVPFEVPVQLTIPPTGVATTDPQNVIVVPTNNRTARFIVRTTGALGVVGIDAKLEGSQTRSNTLQVLPIISALQLPSSVIGGGDITGRVRLESNLPFGGVTVALESNKSIATINPPANLIFSNEQEKTFSVATSEVLRESTVNIRAFYVGVAQPPIEGESQRTFSLTVSPEPKEKERDKAGLRAEPKISAAPEGPRGPLGPIGPIDEAFVTGRPFIRSIERPPDIP